jgi:two-component system response regulator NreC
MSSVNVPKASEPLSRGLGAKYRVLIADDHTIVREGLRALLESDDSLQVVGAVDNGSDAVRLVNSLKPDVALMDLSMPEMDGLSAVRQLVRRMSDTRIVILTMHKTEEHVRAALEAGARGYVVKDASRGELLMAIRSVLQGRKFISATVADRIVSGYLGAEGMESNVRSLSDTLTARERQVLKLIAEGRRNREIAQALFVSVKTVEKHRANLMSKLNLHNTAALTAFAIGNSISVT